MLKNLAHIDKIEVDIVGTKDLRGIKATVLYHLFDTASGKLNSANLFAARHRLLRPKPKSGAKVKDPDMRAACRLHKVAN